MAELTECRDYRPEWCYTRDVTDARLTAQRERQEADTHRDEEKTEK